MKRLLSSVLLLLASAAVLAQPLQQKTISAINSTPTATCSANSCVVFDMRTQGTAQVQVTGTYTASGGLSLQSTVDGVTWVTVGASGTFRRLATGATTATITSGETGIYQLSGDCVAAYACRITALGAVTGSATVSVLTSPAAAGGVANISGGAGDASASNQVSQIAQETAIAGGVGTAADAAATQGSTGSVSAKLRTVTSQLNSIDGKLPALGQALAAGSVPVILPSATITTLTPPASIAVAQGSTTSGQTGPIVQAAVTTAAPTYTTGQTAPLSVDTSGQLRITGTVSAGGVAQGSTTSGQTGGLVQAAVTTAAPSYTTGQTSPLSLDTSGNLRVAVSGGAGSTISGSTAHDAAGSAVNPVAIGGYASAAAPTNVSADTDIVRAWYLRSGAVVNQQSFGGVLASAGSGTNGTGVQRVTVATDDTLVASLATKLDTLHTDIVASNSQLPAALGATTSSGSLSVTPATNAAFVLGAGSATIGSLTANQSVNVAQLNGVTPLMGAGNTGTGSPRVTIATDQAAIPTHGHGTLAATAPTSATLAGVKSGANMVALTQGSTTVKIDTASAATAELVALTSSQQIRVTSASVIAGGTGTIKFVYGTGTNCGTGTTDLTGAYPLVANAGLTLGGGLGPAIIVPASQALCITTTGSVQMSGHVTYAKYAD